jgi:predicted CoA-substrate-specific enzyme activase
VAGAEAARQAFRRALSGLGLSNGEVKAVVGTGYGRARVPFADRAVTEIMCHARGAFEHVGGGVTVVDVGGQDVKAIRVGDDGKVGEFVMNDRCAAGTGRFLEIMARALEMDLVELAEVDPARPDAAKVNNMCTVFAESEVIGYLHEGVPPAAIGAGLLLSVADRIAAMARRAGGDRYVLSGGVALNAGFARALSMALGREIGSLPQPQLVGAFGAALLAREQ